MRATELLGLLFAAALGLAGCATHCNRTCSGLTGDDSTRILVGTLTQRDEYVLARRVGNTPEQLITCLMRMGLSNVVIEAQYKLPVEERDILLRQLAKHGISVKSFLVPSSTAKGGVREVMEVPAP